MNKTKLPATIVGIDTETTSLDPREGEIIEVAAIRYDISNGLSGGQETSEFVRLAQPSTPLTSQITAITGITQDMVTDQPPFAEHIEELKKFIGDSPVFAHNAPFDIGYLAEHGVELDNIVWDTFALSSIAWPEAESYNLGMLANMLGIKVEGEHRAGEDVRMTWQLLQKIATELQADKDTYEHISRLLERSKNTHYAPLFSPFSLDREKARMRVDAEAPTAPHSQGPLNPNPSPHGGEKGISHSLEDILGPNGLLERMLPNFQHRSEQLQMARTVEETIREKYLTLIEAGTGTGKTYGYLIPLVRALPDVKQVFVATHTKNLQDQLVKNDIPKLLKALGIKLNVATLKGRRNYLCLSRLTQALGRTSYTSEEAFLLIKLIKWLGSGGSGDLEHVNTSHQAAHLLSHLHADAISCRTTCPKENPNCPYQRAKRAAQAAQVVVINHALLAQLHNDDNSLPLTHVVVDEAHHLEEVIRDATAHDFTEHHIAEVIAPFVQIAKDKAISPATRRHIQSEAKQVLADYGQLRITLTNHVTRSAPTGLLQLTPSTRTSTSWQKIADKANTWRGRLQFLIGLLEGLPARRIDGPATDKLTEARRQAENFMRSFDQLIHGDPARVQWLEVPHIPGYQGEPGLEIHDVALHLADYVKPLLTGAASITFTSATLTVDGEFDYIKEQLSLQNAQTKQLGTSFNYQDNMLIYIVDDSPNPAADTYDEYTADIISDLATLLGGRTLGLFTSHQSVKQVYHKALKKLNKAKIKLMAQRLTGGRHAVASRFAKVHRSVLLGTYSFWEGVDIPGPSLSAVVIPKLPFTRPNDPVIDALAGATNKNAFTDLSVPAMVLKLRQGVGRLIRSDQDHGAIIILDSRFLNRQYRNSVLHSLPPGTVHIGPSKDIAKIMTNWFGADQLKKWQDK